MKEVFAVAVGSLVAGVNHDLVMIENIKIEFRTLIIHWHFLICIIIYVSKLSTCTMAQFIF